jgi:hypothetical protein
MYEFEMEEDDLFLGYVDTDALSIELMQVMCVYEGSVKALLRLNKASDALSIELMQVICVYEGSVKALLRLI